MKSRDIDIENFSTIEELYSFIDENAFNLEGRRDLTNLWVKFRDCSKDEDEIIKAQWEIDCFIFDIKGSNLFPHVYSFSHDRNDIKKYPDIDVLAKSAINYVKARANNTNNPFLRARYNHLLWKCSVGTKHNSYALIAIENYIQTIHTYCLIFESDNNKEIPIQIGRLYENLIAVSNEVRAKK